MQVFIIAALTADGYIAKKKIQKSTDWTSDIDKVFFQDRTKKAGAVIMGYTTYQTIGRPLTDRLNLVYTKNPNKITQSENLKATRKDPKQLLKDLHDQGRDEVAIIGGASIYTMFLNAGLVNKLYLTVEPILFGQGISLFDKSLDIKLKLVTVQHLSEQTIVLEYEVINSWSQSNHEISKKHRFPNSQTC